MKEPVENLHQILEAAIFAAGEPLTIDKLQQLFAEGDHPTAEEIKKCLADIADQMKDRGVELVEVASGFRFQAKKEYAMWLKRLWEKKPSRYSRALLETLSLIVYKQPITRGEIEEVRGVAVSTHIIKTLQEREWIKVVGHRDVPGKPALFSTTKQFLDYFNLKSLSELPPLQELVNIEKIEQELNEQLALNFNVKTSNTSVEASTHEEVIPEEITSEEILQDEINPEKITSEEITSEEVIPEKTVPDETTVIESSVQSKS